jgi:hypothetical protein
MNFTKNEKYDILRIIISVMSIIISFILSLDYISWIAVILCGIPIIKECIDSLIKEFDLKADLLVSVSLFVNFCTMSISKKCAYGSKKR